MVSVTLSCTPSWQPRYNWNIVQSSVKPNSLTHHWTLQLTASQLFQSAISEGWVGNVDSCITWIVWSALQKNVHPSGMKCADLLARWAVQWCEPPIVLTDHRTAPLWAYQHCWNSGTPNAVMHAHSWVIREPSNTFNGYDWAHIWDESTWLWLCWW